MDVTIKIQGNFTAKVRNVGHPGHAINRLRKFLQENDFAIGVDPAYGYKPPSAILFDFDEMDIAERLDVDEHVTDPSVWLDKADIEQLENVLWQLEDTTARRVRTLIAEQNSI